MYEEDFILQNNLDIKDNRVSNDGRATITGVFLFHKKPTHWNNLFKIGFNKVDKFFSYTPAEIINLSAGKFKRKDGESYRQPYS